MFFLDREGVCDSHLTVQVEPKRGEVCPKG